MKKILIIIAFLLLAMEAFGQSAKDLYNKYSDLNGVSAVYVSPAMFRMIGKLPDVDMESESGEKVNLTPIGLPHMSRSESSPKSTSPRESNSPSPK